MLIQTRYERPFLADTVEKLQNFLAGKFIFDITNSKNLLMGGDLLLTISINRAAGELTCQVLCGVRIVLVFCRKIVLHFFRVFQQYRPYSDPGAANLSVSFGEISWFWKGKFSNLGFGGSNRE